MLTGLTVRFSFPAYFVAEKAGKKSLNKPLRCIRRNQRVYFDNYCITPWASWEFFSLHYGLSLSKSNPHKKSFILLSCKYLDVKKTRSVSRRHGNTARLEWHFVMSNYYYYYYYLSPKVETLLDKPLVQKLLARTIQVPTNCILFIIRQHKLRRSADIDFRFKTKSVKYFLLS